MKRKYFSIKQLGLFLAMGVISTSVYANTALQSVKVTVHYKNAPISKVLDDIEQQTGYSILVRNNDIDIKQKVTVNVTDETLNRVLTDVFEGMDVKYDVENGTISIYKPKETSVITTVVNQNKKTISGVIFDPN
ncbi:STN domain-containing protein, partial [Parabacteroides leei]